MLAASPRSDDGESGSSVFFFAKGVYKPQDAASFLFVPLLALDTVLCKII